MSDVGASRIYCNYCEHHTHHKLLYSHAYDNRSEEDGVEMYGEFRLWSCAGCDSCTLEDHYTSDMFSQLRDGAYVQEYDSIYYPESRVGFRNKKQFQNLPPKLSKLYDEVISAHNDKLHILCSAGLRGLIEGICADKNISGRDLEKKIGGLTAVLPANIVENLHGLRFIGNDAVHELESPNEFTLTVALDVVEDILNFLYALDYKVTLLEKLKGKETRVRAKGGAAKDKA